MENEILSLKLKEDILISPKVGFLKPLEYYRVKEAILAGERATKDALPEIKQLLSKKRRYRSEEWVTFRCKHIIRQKANERARYRLTL